MLKSVFNGIGSGFGRIVGKCIGIGIIGYLAYCYMQKNNVEIPSFDDIEEAIFYEKN